MAKRNQHKKSLWVNDVNNIKCYKKNCPGVFIHCIVKYGRNKFQEEYECSECSMVKRRLKDKKKKYTPSRFNNNPRQTSK